MFRIKYMSWETFKSLRGIRMNRAIYPIKNGSHYFDIQADKDRIAIKLREVDMKVDLYEYLSIEDAKIWLDLLEHAIAEAERWEDV